MYIIERNIADATIERVDQYPWNCAYQPRVEFYLIFKKSIGFILNIKCFESHPKADYRNHGDPVYKDSCLEFFVNFFPELEEKGYLNFEMNANGAMLLCFGLNRTQRINMIQRLETKHHVERTLDYWSIELVIPLSFIHEIYDISDFSTGHRIKANVYKCGDCTDMPHYGCWSFIQSENPDFHRPEYFATMMLV